MLMLINITILLRLNVVNVLRLDEGECHRSSPAEKDDHFREEGTNSWNDTDMIYIDILLLVILIPR